MDNTRLRDDCEFVGDTATQVSRARLEGVATATPERRKKQREVHRVPALNPPLGIVSASICGMVAAVFYTIANIALRHCVSVDPFLVSAVKALPTVIVLTPLLGWMLYRGDTIATSSKMVPRFIAASFVGQLVGNAAFQVALGVIGLAASVPITLGVMIILGAVLGRMMLHEPVRPRMVLAMVILIIAVIALSLPNATPSPRSTGLPIWVGALCAAASGAGYALYGVVMRQTLMGGLSVPATMFISGAVGTVALWSVTLLRLGIGPFETITSDQWSVMIAAGAFNFTAFAALTVALKSLPVIAVNLINASQVAMAAVAGVLLFAEPVTTGLILGILLTIAGLLILAKKRAPAEERTSVD